MQRLQRLLSYDGGKTGTSHLNRHKCKVPAECTPITSFFSEKKPSITASVKQNVTTACVRWCAKDMRPFDVVCDEGFLKLADELISIGARHGIIAAKYVLPHPTTLSRKVAEVAEELREAIKPAVRQAIEEGRCAFTVDMWTDDYKKVAYITATAHYVNDEWELVSLVLFTCDFPPEKKTGDNIRKELVRRCAKLGYEEAILENVVFVTDQGANIINALRPYTRMSCTAHILNTVLRHTFDDEYLAEQLPELQKSLKKVKAIVTFLKQSGLCNQLPHGVCQEVSTRWNSKVAMIKSLVTQYEDIESLLDSRGNTLMEDLNKAALKDVVNFLEPFKEASEKLEQDKQPTLPLVLLYQRKLKGHLTPVAADTRTISQLKKRAAQFLETKLQLEEIHYVATLLWPPFRQLRALKEAERTAVFSTVRQMMLGVPEVPSEQETGEECTSTKPPKRRLLDEFQDWHDHAETDIDDDELDSYLHAGGSCEGIDGLLKWWKSQCKKYPRLSFLARKILCIPATSATSERNFSAAGYIIQERRTCLKPDTLDNLLFLHKNM